MKLATSLLLVLFGLSYRAGAQDVEDIINSAKSDRQKADTLFSVAIKKFVRSRFDSASFYLKEGIRYAVKTRDDEFITYYYLSLGNASILDEKAKEGLVELKKAEPYLSKASYKLRMKYLLFSGMAFDQLNAVDSSLYYYHRCENLNNVNDPYSNWYVYGRIALLFQQAEDYEQSEKYFIKAYELTKERGIRVDYGIILYEFANLYYDWNKAEKFAEIMEEQQKFVQAGKKNYSGDPMHSMLFDSWQGKPFDKKVAFLENVKARLMKNGSKKNAALANVYLAEFYENENKPEKALGYAQENEKLLEGENDILKHYTNAKLLYRLLKKTGRSNEALKEADRLFSMKDSIIKLQQRETLADLQTKYETEKKEKDIVLLNTENRLNIFRLSKERDLKQVLLRENLLKDSAVKKEKEYNHLLGYQNELKISQLENEKALKASASRENLLKSNQLKKEARIRWLLISGGLLLLLCGLVIFILYRKQRSKNLLIQKQADDLQMLMKEIHHRVKNNLQVISSLLDLQSLTIKDRQASEAIKESRNRVYSMALIHQNLYKDSSIIGIEMKDYINKLVESLLQSYNAGENKITLETDIDPFCLMLTW